MLHTDRKLTSGALPEKLHVLPVKWLEFRAVKYDVALREAPLWATLAMHTILSRMVMFRCTCCNERFATFHPAYRPPDELDLHMLGRPKRYWAPACSIDVASWDEAPPFEEAEEELLLARTYEGRCQVCDVDVKNEMKKHRFEDEAEVVPLRGWQNRMDPCWRFPHHELRELFAQMTVTEARFVALEHQQVDYVTVRWTGLGKFRKNIISFPQDVRRFVERYGMLQDYKVRDRVNSVRGPGADPDRPPKLARDATPEELSRCAVDPHGRLVYPATVRRVEGAAILMLEYDEFRGELYPERTENLTSRVQMPWQPRQLQGALVIFLTQNVKFGDAIEGLEVRWGLVCRVMRALTSRPDVYAHMRLNDGRALPWRDGGGPDEPMHRWYDMRQGMFDVLSEADCRRLYAPRHVDGELMSPEEAEALGVSGTELTQGEDLWKVEDLLAAGLDVRFDREEETGASEDVVGKDEFRNWVVLKGLAVASELLKWWMRVEVSAEGVSDGWKTSGAETVVDFFEKIRADLHEREWLEQGEMTVFSLAKWCRTVVGEDFGGDDFSSLEDLAEYMRLEFRIVHERHGVIDSSGAMEDGAPRPDVDVEAEESAKRVAGIATGKVSFGWHGVADDPSGMSEVGRFEKGHPLEFPMGIGGRYDDQRPRPEVPVRVWAQHLLRLWGGWCVHGLRGHRLVWAIVNTVLLEESRGKGYVVQKVALRRMGARLGVGADTPLTREELRAALKDEETAASLVHVLMTVGQGVRSTPMQWAKESKELDCAVKQLSWAPPWVLPAAGFDPRSEPWCYVGDNEQVKDPLGRGSDGRIPATWWTLNHRYNFDYEVHRLCLADGLHVTGSTMEEDARRALGACDDAAKKFRYRFVRHAPDIAVYIHALRAELHMRIVMPSVLGHSRDVPYLSMARFETGAGGNMHWHGVSYGVGNPRIDKAREELVHAVPAPDARSDEAKMAATEPPPDPEGESSSAPSPESVDEDEDMEDGRRYAAPARARPRTKTVGPASATARGRGRPQKRGKRGRGAAAGRGASPELGLDAADPVLPRPEPVTQEAKEELFWKYFHDKVSEWNPCFGEGEEVRFR